MTSTSPTRRAVLGGAGAVALATLRPTTSASAAAAPPPGAAQVGMNRLTFQDDFTSLSTIDVAKSGAPGYSWYLRAPWQSPSMNPWDLAIGSDSTTSSFLRITPSVNNINWTISTTDPRTGNGRSFVYGYVEARLRFWCPPEPRWDSAYALAWPSVWAITRPELLGQSSDRNVELDVFEACAGPGGHVGVVHDLRDGSRWSSSNAIHQLGADFAQWHTFAARWTPDGACWFFDDQWVMTQYWGPGGPSPQARFNYYPTTLPSPRDLFTGFVGAPMVFALGSGIGANFDVDWFRIWQW